MSGRIFLDPNLLDSALAEASRLAVELADGDPSSLPGSILQLMDIHAEAIDTAPMDQLRQELTDQVNQPPYDEDRARQLGQSLIAFIDASQRQAEAIFEADQRAADIFRF